MTSHSPPLIGISLDAEAEGSFAGVPYYAVTKVIAHQLIRRGAQVVMLPHDLSAVQRYASMVQGLVLPGGPFLPIDPAIWATQPLQQDDVVQQRVAFEYQMIRAMKNINKPILGMCGGCQMMNAAYGGTLNLDLSKQLPQHSHRDGQWRTRTSHGVTLNVDAWPELKAFAGVQVNSGHRQAIERVGQGLEVWARASDDGVIEAVRDAKHSFCVGVQWHPEYQLQSLDQWLFDQFVSAVRQVVVS